MRHVLVFLLATLPALSQDFAAVEQSAKEEIARLRIPGAAIAVVKGDRVVYSGAVGVANVETGEAVRPEMLFRLGSTTKMFTAAALCGLAAEGKIDLKAPVGKYIAGLPPRLSKTTGDQLLSHTAGVLDTAPMYGSHDDDALGKGIRSWTDEWLFTSPGRIFSYSNPGYWMAGYLVEVLHGKAYADAMTERLFEPLGMKRTTLRPTTAMTWPLAQGHNSIGGGAPYIARPAADNAASWPAGSMFSSVSELARFTVAFLNDGMVEGKRALDPKAIAMLSTAHAKYPGSDDAYGYGLTIREHRGVRMVEHGGSRMGYGSSIRMAPAQRVAVIVATNRSGATLPATAEKALEMMVSLKERVAPARRETATSGVVGVYRNGDQRIEVVERGGKLVVVRGASEVPFSGYVTVPGEGRVEYLWSGSRAFARVR
jgi:CubicO group peptidase (beta-lactamase class C family)